MMQSNPLLILPGGERFEGSYLNSTTPLQGKLNYLNGDVYIGTFKNNLRHGYGTYNYHATREIYEGEWQFDLWHGKGTYSVITGEVKIAGNWQKGLLNGSAQVTHNNGDRFLGTFRNGLKEGEG